MINPFGSQYVYNPIPSSFQIEIIGAAQSGKSKLAAVLCKPGIVVVIDSDGEKRFQLSVPFDSKCEFYPLSDHQPDMLDPKIISDKLNEGMGKIGKQVSTIIIDSVTSILEPIIGQIQRDIDENKVKNKIAAWKPKSEAMRFLRNSTNGWNSDTIWIYHTEIKTDTKANQTVGKSVSDTEVIKLAKLITLSLEVVVENGKRGVKVLRAREGRSLANGKLKSVVWDENGDWKGFREKLLQSVYGGLTEKEQQSIIEDVPEFFNSSNDAIVWAVTKHSNVFKDELHAKNSLKKLHTELVELLGDDYDKSTLWQKWVEKVLGKLNEYE